MPRGKPRFHGHVGTGRENLPPLFDLKIAYSYVIEVADSESTSNFAPYPAAF